MNKKKNYIQPLTHWLQMSTELCLEPSTTTLPVDPTDPGGTGEALSKGGTTWEEEPDEPSDSIYVPWRNTLWDDDEEDY